MDKLNRFLDSPVFRRFALILGFIGTILKFLDTYFSTTITTITTIALIIIGIYLGAVILRILSNWIIQKINLKFREFQASLGSELINVLRSEFSNQEKSKLILPFDDELDYEYQAKRYGMGYSSFEVQCVIEPDGSAKVIREVTIEAYSELSSLDTFIRIAEKDPDGKSRDVEIGQIETKDKDRQLTLKPITSQQGRTLAKIDIYPPLKSGETLHYIISDFHLPKGLFGINLSREEISKRENPIDYFGWHINRPTRKFVMQIYFPTGGQPVGFRSEVRYTKAAGDISDQKPIEEEKKLKKPVFSRSGDRYVLNSQIDYPLSGLIYMVGWNPISKNDNPIP